MDKNYLYIWENVPMKLWVNTRYIKWEKNEKNKIGFEKKWERYFKIGNFLLKYLF